MILDASYIKINNVAVGDMLTEAIFGFNKLWAEDTGRSLSGSWNGELKGIFPKLELTFRPLNQTELQMITKLLDTEYQQLTYYDPNKEQLVTMQTYAGDYNYTIKNTWLTSSFKISFIATRKRA